ncbi:MAG TPA: MFS transporter [Miltoncostaeaceae bacterium]|nr:MFS transporter [Miltoncostaeaceae bacterium]
MAAQTDSSVRSLLAIPEVGRTLTASLVGRLPYTAIGLLVILRVREMGGGYAEGGVAAGSFALGLACLSPFVGRLVDMRGQRAVLVPCAVASAVPLVALALVPDGTSIAVVAALAALGGIVHPPLSGAMRALWPELVPPRRRHAAYAIESAGVELTFIVGPLLLVGALAAATSPGVGLLACAGLLVAGTLAFVTAPSSRRWRPARAARTVAGALASPGLVTLLIAVACMGSSFGAIEVATAASADEGGSRALVGPLLAAWALGSMAGGLLSARGRAPADPHRRLTGLLAATAVADGLVALAPSLPALGIALFLAGACIAPAFATLYAMVADLAREGTLTESYTWLTTGIAAGIAAGSAAGGAVVDAVSTHAAIGGAAGMVALAALIATAGRRVVALPAPA